MVDQDGIRSQAEISRKLLPMHAKKNIRLGLPFKLKFLKSGKMDFKFKYIWWTESDEKKAEELFQEIERWSRKLCVKEAKEKNMP
jgi:hypothetical protein